MTRNRTRHVPLVLLGGLGASVLSMLLFSHLAEEILENEAFAFDTTLVQWARARRSPLLDRLFSAVTATGEPWALALAGVLMALRWLRGHREADTATLALALGGGGLLNEVLKQSFHRPRPALRLRRAHATGYSFPSGHAMTTLALYGTAGILAARHGMLTHQPAAALICVPTGLLCLLVGASRVYLEVHYPTDVVGAWAVGTVWLTTCSVARAFMEPEES
jgi:membrane-associated phospholipid phosphatase